MCISWETGQFVVQFVVLCTNRHNFPPTSQNFPLHSSVASPICQEGQSETTFPIFAFSSRFFLFFPEFFPSFPNFWQVFRCQGWHSASPLPPQWLRHCHYTLTFLKKSTKTKLFNFHILPTMHICHDVPAASLSSFFFWFFIFLLWKYIYIYIYIYLL